MKKLLLDVDSILPLYTKGYLYGVGRSTYELVNALNNIEGIPFEITLFSHNMKGLGCKNIDTQFKKLHFYLPNRFKFNNISNKLNLRKLFSGYDLMHIPHNTDGWESIGRTIYTIHDLIVYHYPEMWGLTDTEREQHKYIAENCKSIVTCSQASKKDIVKIWNVPEEKVKVIYWGLNRDIFYPDSQMKQPTFLSDIKSNFFFCASCNHPRKQPTLIVDAFTDYVKCGGNHQLVMLKPFGIDHNKYRKLIDDKKLIILDNVSDNVLRWLYSNAKASVVASLYEGFGFPVLESLACHTQVICANNSSLIEAGGKVVDYISADSLDGLSQKFSDYSTLHKADTVQIQELEQHLKEFTWDRCASRYVSYWYDLLNTNL